MMKWTFRILITLLLIVILFSGYRIFNMMCVYGQIKDTYDDIAALVVQTVPSVAPEETELTQSTTAREGGSAATETEVTEAELQVDPYYSDLRSPIAVDFETLCGINSDVVGWIYCEGTSINYPVLKGEDNEEYLYHQYDGTYSSGGSIFMDYRCESDFSSDYTVIYGHNMLADSMFNCLDYFREQDYLEDHSRLFYLTAEGKIYCLEAICTNLTAYKDELRLFELRDDELDLELIRGNAEADTGIEASNEDKLVLLATCTYDFKNAKCTLLCKAIELTP